MLSTISVDNSGDSLIKSLRNAYKKATELKLVVFCTVLHFHIFQ
jgi:hypothetical protein